MVLVADDPVESQLGTDASTLRHNKRTKKPHHPPLYSRSNTVINQRHRARTQDRRGPYHPPNTQSIVYPPAPVDVGITTPESSTSEDRRLEGRPNNEHLPSANVSGLVQGSTSLDTILHMKSSRKGKEPSRRKGE